MVAVVGAVELDLAAQQVLEVDRLDRKPEAAGLDPLQVQKRVDELAEPLCLPMDVAQVPRSRLGVELPRCEELGKAENAGERSSCDTVATRSDLSCSAWRSAVMSRSTTICPTGAPSASRTGAM